jgi:hypothetical protein
MIFHIIVSFFPIFHKNVLFQNEMFLGAPGIPGEHGENGVEGLAGVPGVPGVPGGR